MTNNIINKANINILSKGFKLVKPALLAAAFLALLPGVSAAVSIKQVNAPGPAVRMSSGGNLTASDLNQFAPKNVTLSRGIDINKDTILAGDVDSSGNVSTYLLTQLP